jgi:hypothetical protein
MHSPREQAQRIALATSAALPHLDPDDALLLPALAAQGAAATAVVWDDASIDWGNFDLVVVRSAWDYAARHAEFLQWARSVPRLANSAPVLSWNTDKTYLRALAAVGVPVVPTAWLSPEDGCTADAIGDRVPTAGDFVVKPVVSAGARNTGRYRGDDAGEREASVVLVTRLLSEGRSVMVQPYQGRIDTHGETSLVYLDGQFSHAVRKGALLTGPFVGGDGLHSSEQLQPRAPHPGELEVATRVLSAVDALLPGEMLLYARVDLVPGPGGVPLLLELELAEPSLHLGLEPLAPGRLAAAIVARAEVQRRSPVSCLAAAPKRAGRTD